MASFDDFLDRDRIRDLLAGATGRGVSVGVIDSGVETTHKDLGGSVKASYDVVKEGGAFEVQSCDPGSDFVGHGTACAGIIHELAPDAELYSVRVVGSGRGDATGKLVAGFEFAIKQDWPILNLSLGTSQFNREMWKLAERAHYEEKIVVAAKDNQRGKVGFPAVMSSVIAVDMEHFESSLDFRYWRGREVEIEARGIYIDAPSPGGGRHLYSGTSFACPHVSAIAARLFEKVDGLTCYQLRTILAALGKYSDSESVSKKTD